MNADSMFKCHRLGDILSVIAGNEYLYRLQDTAPSLQNSKKGESVPPARAKRFKGEGEEAEACAMGVPVKDAKRQRKDGLVPLEFEFTENGATVKVIDLTGHDDSAQSVSDADLETKSLEISQILPHLEKHLIQRILRKLEGDVEATINLLLGMQDETKNDVDLPTSEEGKYLHLSLV